MSFCTIYGYEVLGKCWYMFIINISLRYSWKNNMFKLKASTVISACLTLQNNKNTFLGFYLSYMCMPLSNHLPSRLHVR
jgi:hypothetical protein